MESNPTLNDGSQSASLAGSAKCGWTTFKSEKECGKSARYRWQIPGGIKPICEHHSREIRAMRLGILTAISPNMGSEPPFPAK